MLPGARSSALRLAAAWQGSVTSPLCCEARRGTRPCRPGLGQRGRGTILGAAGRSGRPPRRPDPPRASHRRAEDTDPRAPRRPMALLGAVEPGRYEWADSASRPPERCRTTRKHRHHQHPLNARCVQGVVICEWNLFPSEAVARTLLRRLSHSPLPSAATVDGHNQRPSPNSWKLGVGGKLLC